VGVIVTLIWSFPMRLKVSGNLVLPSAAVRISVRLQKPRNRLRRWDADVAVHRKVVGVFETTIQSFLIRPKVSGNLVLSSAAVEISIRFQKPRNRLRRWDADVAVHRKVVGVFETTIQSFLIRPKVSGNLVLSSAAVEIGIKFLRC
jgi:hypothetical protein